MSDYLSSVRVIKEEYEGINPDGRGIFWIIFSFLLSLLVAKWSWGLVFVIAYAGAFLIGRTMLDYEYGSDLNTKLIFVGSILASILGYILGRSLLASDPLESFL